MPYHEPSLKSKKWACPHCGHTMERIDMGGDVENLTAGALGLGTTYCESCHKPVDYVKVMQGRYDTSFAEGCLQFIGGLIFFAIVAFLIMACSGAFG